MQVRLCKGMGSGRMRWFMDTYLQHVQPSTWDFHHRSLPGPSSKRRAKGLGAGSQGMGGCHQWYSHDAHGKQVFCIFNCQFFIRNLPSWFPPKKKQLAASYCMETWLNGVKFQKQETTSTIWGSPTIPAMQQPNALVELVVKGRCRGKLMGIERLPKLKM